MYKPYTLSEGELLFYTNCDLLTKNGLQAFEKHMIMMCSGTLYTFMMMMMSTMRNVVLSVTFQEWFTSVHSDQSQTQLG